MRTQLVGPALALVRGRAETWRAWCAEFALPPPPSATPRWCCRSIGCGAFSTRRRPRDPLLGLHLAQRIRRGAYGLLEFACRSAPTVGEALRRIVRYISLSNELVEVTLVEGARGGHRAADPRASRCASAATATSSSWPCCLVQSRSLTGPRRRALAGLVRASAAARRAALVALVGTDRIAFDCERNGMALPRALMAAPLSSHDPALLELLDKQAEAALSLRASPSRFLGQVRQQVARRLRDGVPSLDEAARRPAHERAHAAAAPLRRGHELARAASTRCARSWRAAGWPSGARPLGEMAFLLGVFGAERVSARVQALDRQLRRASSALARAVMRSGARGHRRPKASEQES